MRPGQAAPEFNEAECQYPSSMNASMRPGQAAPEFAVTTQHTLYTSPRFNEAGAGCPGIPRISLTVAGELP